MFEVAHEHTHESTSPAPTHDHGIDHEDTRPRPRRRLLRALGWSRRQSRYPRQPPWHDDLPVDITAKAQRQRGGQWAACTRCAVVAVVENISNVGRPCTVDIHRDFGLGTFGFRTSTTLYLGSFLGFFGILTFVIPLNLAGTSIRRWCCYGPGTREEDAGQSTLERQYRQTQWTLSTSTSINSSLPREPVKCQLQQKEKERTKKTKIPFVCSCARGPGEACRLQLAQPAFRSRTEKVLYIIQIQMIQTQLYTDEEPRASLSRGSGRLSNSNRSVPVAATSRRRNFPSAPLTVLPVRLGGGHGLDPLSR